MLIGVMQHQLVGLASEEGQQHVSSIHLPSDYACIRTSEVEIPFTTKKVAEDQQKGSVAMQSHCRLICCSHIL